MPNPEHGGSYVWNDQGELVQVDPPAKDLGIGEAVVSQEPAAEPAAPSVLPSGDQPNMHGIAFVNPGPRVPRHVDDGEAV